jgi:hypothetical protein
MAAFGAHSGPCLAMSAKSDGPPKGEVAGLKNIWVAVGPEAEVAITCPPARWQETPEAWARHRAQCGSANR